MLTALGEYRDLSLSEPAPPAPEFPRPDIPPGRPGKRMHGFMSLREPLADDWGHHQHAPRHGTMPGTSSRATGPSGVATPTQQHVPGPSFSGASASQFDDTPTTGPSCYIPPQCSSYDPATSFFGTPSQHPPHPYGSMTALLTDPSAFGLQYSAHSFDLGGSSHSPEQGFSTPHQPIPLVQSPMWDLNSTPATVQTRLQQQPDDDDDDDDDGEEEEAQLALRRPQRQRRRPRCGTGSHYFDD